MSRKQTTEPLPATLWLVSLVRPEVGPHFWEAVAIVTSIERARLYVNAPELCAVEMVPDVDYTGVTDFRVLEYGQPEPRFLRITSDGATVINETPPEGQTVQ